jgi:uncharacterized membrane protein
MTRPSAAGPDWSNRAEEVGWWFGGSILGPTRRFAAAIIITAGPWLVAVAALAVITTSMLPVLGKSALEDLNLSVIYAFCLAPLVAGPIGAVAARMVRRAVEESAGRLVSEIFLTAAITAGLLTQALAMILCMALGIAPLGIAVALIFLAVSAALLWVGFAVLCAFRSYGVLIAAFSAGMALSVACTMLAARVQPTVEMLVWSFSAGLSLTIALFFLHAFRRFGRNSADLSVAALRLKAELWRSRILVISVLVAICGVWADKWFFWFGPLGVQSSAGFLHYPPYDSVMFLAHLSIVPTFASMLLFQDHDIEAAIAVFRRSLKDNATHAVIRETVERLGSVVLSGVLRIAFVQGVVTSGLVLMSPLLSETLAFSFRQLLLLQVALIAVYLQSLFYLAGSILVLCSQSRLFALVQFLFLMTNLIGSFAFFSTMGVSAYAIFSASLVCAVVTLLLAFRSLRLYDYLVFVGENDSLYPDHPGQTQTSK